MTQRKLPAGLRKLTSSIRKLYDQALEELEAKFKEFRQNFDAKDARFRARVEAGTMTEFDYQSWLRGQVFQGKQWEDKVSQMAETLTHTNEIAYNMANDVRNPVFAECANQEAYELEKGCGFSMSFQVYNDEAVKRLLMDNPRLLPKKTINTPESIKYDAKLINTHIQQAIVQGQTLQEMTDNVMSTVVGSERRYAQANAATAYTSAENAGRLQSMKNAEAQGVKLEKQWIATLDLRTRRNHQLLDMEHVPIDEKFKVGGEEIDFPGDPNASKAMVYNCRCSIRRYNPKYPPEGNRRDNITGEVISGMSYEEWLKAKETGSNGTSQNAFTGNKNDATISSEAHTSIQDRNGGRGKASAIMVFDIELNTRQSKLLESLSDSGSYVIVPKNGVSMSDLAAMTAKTGVEFAMFTKQGERMIMRGDNHRVPVGIEKAKELRKQGYKWSGHTHPGVGANVMQASKGDYIILNAFGQNRSVIYDSFGHYDTFGGN